MQDYILHIWFAIGFLHMLYLSLKMLPHFKDGYGHYFWLGFWLYKPDSLDTKGQHIRIIMIIALSIYLVVGITIARTINS